MSDFPERRDEENPVEEPEETSFTPDELQETEVSDEQHEVPDSAAEVDVEDEAVEQTDYTINPYREDTQELWMAANEFSNRPSHFSREKGIDDFSDRIETLSTQEGPEEEQIWRDAESFATTSEAEVEEESQPLEYPPAVVPVPTPEMQQVAVRRAEQTAGRGRVEEMAPEPTRQRRGGRLAIFPLALGLIVLGGLLLASKYVEGLNFEIDFTRGLVVLSGALVLTFMFRFFLSGRRERGLFFLAVVLIMWGVVLAMAVLGDEQFPLAEFWPLVLAGIGVAFFFTFLFERTHQGGLVLPGIMLMFASGIALAVMLDVIGDSTQEIINDYWPLLLTLIGIVLLPNTLVRKKA
jgi:hypothetical protein